jgi:hypothetical protein
VWPVAPNNNNNKEKHNNMDQSGVLGPHLIT